MKPTHRHYKGGLYRVLAKGVHDANNGRDYDRLSVIYQSCEEGYIAMRYEDEFFGFVVVDGKQVWRFEPLPEYLDQLDKNQ